MKETYTAEMVWESAMQNEWDSAHEENREIADSRFYAARNLELYADMFGVNIADCIAFAKSEYKGFDWARSCKEDIG